MAYYKKRPNMSDGIARPDRELLKKSKRKPERHKILKRDYGEEPIAEREIKRRGPTELTDNIDGVVSVALNSAVHRFLYYLGKNWDVNRSEVLRRILNPIADEYLRNCVNVRGEVITPQDKITVNKTWSLNPDDWNFRIGVT